ncbi:MAG: hypothetical protein WA705_06145, partial [Candidatus Ozemobacteraceae bacterium]
EPSAVYRPRDPKASAYYRCIEDYFEEFVRVYDERFSKKFGFWGAAQAGLILGKSSIAILIVAICTTVSPG